jgi:ubiquinone/menaquinone biosynthesis C-methylase UbiE
MSDAADAVALGDRATAALGLGVGRGAEFVPISELSGEPISRDQLKRLQERYVWAGAYCRDADVLEVACGSGPGLGHLARTARSLVAGDLSNEALKRAQKHYDGRVRLFRLDAEWLPLADASVDVVILCEAIYYLPRPHRFATEAKRVLRSGGWLLIVSANKDVPGFQPSLHSHKYLGVLELDQWLRQLEFRPHFFGSTPLAGGPWRQQVLRPLQRLAGTLGVMPQTMRSKRLLRRFVFGPLVPMPAEIVTGQVPCRPPTPIPSDTPDRQHKVIFCAALRA